MKIGIVGGSQGMGQWFYDFFEREGFEVSFTSADAHSQYADNANLCKSVEMVVLAVPLSAMQPALEEIYPHLNGKMLVEVASVKKYLIDAFLELQQQFPDVQCDFCSIHPMFAPRLKSLEGQVVLFNYQSGSGEVGKLLWERFEHHQARLYELPYLQHDQIMGVVQGLNHFNIFASARTLQLMGEKVGSIKDFSSPSYRIFLIFFARYVLQEPKLYAEIQMYNEFVPEVLELFKAQVEELLELIKQKDVEGFRSYVQTARTYFEENEEDMGISSHLIEQLGQYISRQGKD